MAHNPQSEDNGQTVKWSMIETIVGTLIGFLVALQTQRIVFPWFGWENIEMQTNLSLAAVFTVVSIIRGYIVRRCFNKIHTTYFSNWK